MQTPLSFLLNCKNADNANGEGKNYRAFEPALYAEDETFIPLSFTSKF